jgi:hypothetical protein
MHGIWRVRIGAAISRGLGLASGVENLLCLIKLGDQAIDVRI